MANKSLNNIMKLDLAAINALSIFPRLSEFKKGLELENDTLIGVLDRCKTAIGSRLLRNWVQQPLQDINMIESRQNVVEMLISENEILQNLQNDFLRKTPDL